MPDKTIPCEKCEQMTDYLEKSGFWAVVSCTPIKYKKGKCKLIYKKKN